MLAMTMYNCYISGAIHGQESASASQDIQVFTVTVPAPSTPGAGAVTTSAPATTPPPALLWTAPAPVLLAGKVRGVTSLVWVASMVQGASMTADVPTEQPATMSLASATVHQV